MSAEIARATAQQVCQIGVEAAPARPVAATTRLVSAIRLSPKPAIYDTDAGWDRGAGGSDAASIRRALSRGH